MRYMWRFLALFFITFILSACSSYFTKSSYEDTPVQNVVQNSRIALLTQITQQNPQKNQAQNKTKNTSTKSKSKNPQLNNEKLKVAIRMTYLNALDSNLFYNREYFFLEIFNDDEDVVLPDSMSVRMFGSKPLWIRKVDSNEYDDILRLENTLSEGYLIAFRPASAMEQKKIKVTLHIANFNPAVFDFSYTTLRSYL